MNPELNNPYWNQDEDGELDEEFENEEINFMGDYDDDGNQYD